MDESIMRKRSIIPLWLSIMVTTDFKALKHFNKTQLMKFKDLDAIN